MSGRTPVAALSQKQWLDITASSNMPLYAVLSKVSDANPLREYYIHDGNDTPVGLYRATPYADWTETMPVIVRLDEHSPFLKWVEETEHKDWGWLARSPYNFEKIVDHLRGLVKVIVPGGQEVFFRYWDGKWFAEHLRYMGDDWREVMPPFAFYWVNSESFIVHIHAQSEVKKSPWWHVPQALIDTMLEKDQQPIVHNILQFLKDEYPEIYFRFDQEMIAAKVHRIVKNNNSRKEDIIEEVLIALKQAQ
ncbi:DUF4123 domain-containing protein [Metakosakonia massiliensis]|uniref:DUF4123 domain-containing protein n=1 Tax=Phytobacter massiliensis TaxID=1485952 RepID=UPI0012E93693